MTEDDGFAVRALGHGAKPPRGGPRDSSCFGTSDEFPGRHISPHRLRGWLREEIQTEAPQLRNGPRPQRAQNVCTQLVVASISDCGREKLRLGAVIKSDLGFFDHKCVCHLITSNKNRSIL